jgi:hypothetical protein
VPASPASRPESRHHSEHKRVDKYRIRNGKEAKRADTVYQRRNRDDGIRGVEVPADEEPGNDDPEPLAGQRPFIQAIHVSRFPPCGKKSENGD